jgi:hypothetical protein
MERSRLGIRDDGMKPGGPDRLGYDPNYEILETYIAILTS